MCWQDFTFTVCGTEPQVRVPGKLRKSRCPEAQKKRQALPEGGGEGSIQMEENRSSEKYTGLIGLDLDGTALDDEKRLRPRVRKAVEDAAAAGYAVVPVSGRPIRGLSKEFMGIPAIRYAISCNGAVIHRIDDFAARKWEEIRKVTVPRDAMYAVLKAIEPFDVIPDCFYGGHGNMPSWGRDVLWDRGMNEGIVRYILEDRSFYDDFPAFVRSVDDQVEKMTLSFNMLKNGAEEKRQAAERITKIPGILLVSGAVHNLEVSNEDSGKGRGILHLCELLGIDPKCTMACGDEENDLDMIRKAAFGVAMANALDSVKRAADFVTGSNEEDGVADAIEEFRRRMGR